MNEYIHIIALIIFCQNYNLKKVSTEIIDIYTFLIVKKVK